MFRCPKCRARDEFKVKKTGYSYKVLQEDLPTFQSKRFRISFGKSAIDVTEKAYSKYTMTCSACGHKDKVRNFMEAFSDPMKLFDTGNLCDCGGEIWQDIEVKKQESEEESDFMGDQRRVNQEIRSITRCESCKKSAQAQRIQ